MAGFEDEIDWSTLDSATRADHVRRLFPIVKHIAAKRREKIGEVLATALGPMAPGKPDDLSNFRSGRISVAKAERLHRYLAENHFAEANMVEPSLFPVRSVSAWETFLIDRATTGGLKLIREKEGRGVVQREGSFEEAGCLLRLSEYFCFELTSPHAGVAIAFQNIRQEWHAVPLGADERKLKVRIAKGPQFLPCHGDGMPIYIAERDHIGEHRFVFVTSPHAEMPSETTAILRWQHRGTCQAYSLTVRFVL